MSQRKFSWKERGNSFGFAWQGMKALFRTEHNAWIHFALTVAVVVLSFYFRISFGEAMSLTIVMAMVWSAELFNTALEKTMDFISQERHPQVKLIKDLAAAAVLITALAAVIVGGLIFLPKMF
jgi:diacylglycerol kinase (ATP)